MRLLVYLGHPAHVHFFKNILRSVRDRGGEFRILARPKEVTLDLLEREGLPYLRVGSSPSSRPARLANFLNLEFRTLREIRRFGPDVLGGVHNEVIAAAGRLTGVPSAIFLDSEPVPSDYRLTHPLADVLWTPESFALDLGAKHLRFPGFKELAYLHPRYFSPDRRVLERLAVEEGRPLVLIRWVAWSADHDRGQRGVSPEDRVRITRALAEHARVLVSSEGPLPRALEPFRFPLPPDMLHHALAFSDLAFTDGQTFATEAAVLGVPAVRTNTMASSMSNFRELESRYGLLYSRADASEALRMALELLDDPRRRDMWKAKRSRLLAETVDVVGFGTKLYERLAGATPREIPLVVAELRQAVGSVAS